MNESYTILQLNGDPPGWAAQMSAWTSANPGWQFVQIVQSQSSWYLPFTSYAVFMKDVAS